MSDSESDQDKHNPESYSGVIIGKRLRPKTVKQYIAEINILKK
jgi:hypothetical protein